MNLYIWEGEGVLPGFGSDYPGMICALGNTLEEALATIPSCVHGSFPQEPTEIVNLGNCPGVEPKSWFVWGGE